MAGDWNNMRETRRDGLFNFRIQLEKILNCVLSEVLITKKKIVPFGYE